MLEGRLIKQTQDRGQQLRMVEMGEITNIMRRFRFVFLCNSTTIYFFLLSHFKKKISLQSVFFLFFLNVIKRINIEAKHSTFKSHILLTIHKGAL